MNGLVRLEAVSKALSKLGEEFATAGSPTAKSVLELGISRVKCLKSGALPADVRQWPFYPIEMPTTKDGKGPAIVGLDADSITYEVWGWSLRTHGSFATLPDAINEAMRLSLGDVIAADAAGGEG